MGTPAAAVIMVVVIVVVGAGAYFAFQNGAGNKSSTSTQNGQSFNCQPKASYTCQHTHPPPIPGAHDLSALVPYQSTQAGTAVPVTATLPAGLTATSYTFSFGDGTTVTQASNIADHSYGNPGTYLVLVNATVQGNIHDDYHSIPVLTITPSTVVNSIGAAPGVTGTITANGTSSASPSAVVFPPETVSFAGSYTSAPTNPLYTLAAPTITSNGGSVTSSSNTSSAASATLNFGTPGIYQVTFVGSAVSGTSVAFQNYTWTVFVSGSTFHASTLAARGAASSPHKGTLNVYEYAPGGSTSYDPAIDYETVGYETILNTYQTLIAYNGSSTGPTYSSYVPELAACVPGSPACQHLFGDTLADNPVSGTATNFTFVLSAASNFYDPSTGKSWGVYPTDVMFSLARTMAFSTLPGWTSNNGWIEAQSLLPTGNPGWDGGAHFVGNNTPGNIMSSMYVNGSGCPSIATSSALYHGCITFHATGLGQTWPYFLELIVDPLGSSVVSCGFFSSSVSTNRAFGAPNAGIPGWAAVSGSSDAGDHPCLLPGGGTSTSDASYQTWLAGVQATPTAWDSYELDGSGTLGTYVGNVQWQGAGSGPYYMAALNPGQSYFLKANPGYHQNPQCTYTGCEPAVGGYAGNVSVQWETSPLPGEAAYEAGQADFAGIPTTQTALLLQLIQQGKADAISFPSISVFFWPFNLAFSTSGAATIDTNPITVPSTFMSNSGLRQFLVHSFDYATSEATVNTVDGINYAFNYGGAIPQFMANYYPTNISWPSGDPDLNPADVGGAAWWWAQITNSGNANFYDPQLAGCSSSSPCEFPMVGQTGAPNVDQMIALWASSVATITHGAIKIDLVDINFINLVLNSLYSPPYGNSMPVFQLGWAPDYPDPTDYVAPLYQTNSTYTKADTVWQQTHAAGYNSSGCGNYNNLVYWAHEAENLHGIPNGCQGVAYDTMQHWMAIAGVTAAGPQRVLLYDMIEQVANGLALYIYWGQTNEVASFAPWINGGSINTNVTIGGGTDFTWYSITGTGVA